MPITIRTSRGSATAGSAPKANPAAAASWAPKRTGIGRPRRSSKCESATSAAAGSTATSGVCRIANPAKIPAIIAIPPERGTGRACSERSFGTSSGSPCGALSNQAMSANVTSAEAIGEMKAISGIAVHLVRAGSTGRILACSFGMAARGFEPARGFGESLVEGAGRTPVEHPARPGRIYDEIADQAPDFVPAAGDRAGRAQQRGRHGKEPCRAPERPGDARYQIRSRNGFYVAHEKGPARGGVLHAARDRIDEIAQIDQAAPVAHAREGQRQPGVDPAEQAQKVGLDARPIHEGRPDQHELHPASGGYARQRALGFELGAAVGVLGLEGVDLLIRPAARVLAVYLDRAQEYKAAHETGRGFGEPHRPIDIDSPELRVRAD